MHANSAATFTGALFGAGLTISGVANPSVILDQLRFTDFHMLLTFLSASSCSAPIFAVANYTKFVRIPPKSKTSYGRFSAFDGNIIGGLLLGLGMGLTGACPGTVLVQAASGMPGSRFLLAGGLVGGIIFAKWSQSNRPYTVGKSSVSSSTATHVNERVVPRILIVYEATLICAIFTMSALTPRSKHLVHPVFGGVLIGLAQAASVLIAKKPLGISTAYEDMGKMFWGLIQGHPFPGLQNFIFVSSAFGAASVIGRLLPQSVKHPPVDSMMPPLVSLIGGMALVLGARVAGGCTTRHGISGISSLGASSFVTIFTMFSGALMTANLSG
ncbi:hypothetical protein DM02DRAFT_617976 [Periconia macrospinosa]|uniref:Uncharacterized protein n=1 Tax=Periconia macrospinosa TaxID=97972 RepID=A0A2V1DB22_9PLEO|nr:hypothetical protein DM02DRAFT_617976 [Periconia macrospinosa]